MIPFEREPGAGDPRGGDPRRRRGFGGRLGERMGAGPEIAPRGRRKRLARADAPRAAWLLPPLLLSAVGAGVLFVLRGPDELFGLTFGLVLGLGLLWVLISVLFPARADRTCPQCGREGLARIDPRATHGLYCRHCSWRDESASAFLHAEEEGPLEDIVLRERRGRGEPRRW